MGPAEEEIPTLKRDEEFAKDVFAVFKGGNREQIREKILDPRVSLALKCPEFGVSLASKLLTQVTNGDKIVLAKLDRCVKTTHGDPHDKEYGVAIDYRYLVDDDSRNFSLLTDILEVPRDATVDIMDHPVITTFIKRRWPKGLFYVMAAVYLVFVLCFTFYLLFTFSPHGSGVFGRIFGKDCSRNEWGLCQKVLENNNIQTSNLSKIAYCSRACLNQDAFQACSTNDPKMCASEIGLIISTVILLAQEIWQLIALRADYIREAENFFEWFIIVASLVCLFYREAESSWPGSSSSSSWVGCPPTWASSP